MIEEGGADQEPETTEEDLEVGEVEVTVMMIGSEEDIQKGHGVEVNHVLYEDPAAQYLVKEVESRSC